jgi:hypothetical protein
VGAPFGRPSVIFLYDSYLTKTQFNSFYLSTNKSIQLHQLLHFSILALFFCKNYVVFRCLCLLRVIDGKGCSSRIFEIRYGCRNYLIWIVVAFLQQFKLSKCGSHLISKLRDKQHLFVCLFLEKWAKRAPNVKHCLSKMSVDFFDSRVWLKCQHSYSVQCFCSWWKEILLGEFGFRLFKRYLWKVMHFLNLIKVPSFFSNYKCIFSGKIWLQNQFNNFTNFYEKTFSAKRIPSKLGVIPLLTPLRSDWLNSQTFLKLRIYTTARTKYVFPKPFYKSCNYLSHEGTRREHKHRECQI